MKKPENIFERLFGSFAIGSGRVPIRSNIYGKGGYSAIGTTNSKLYGSGVDRKSPLLGNSAASNLISGYLDRISELKGYQLLDISKLATNFFADYIVNFLADDSNGSQVVTIQDEEGNTDTKITERINKILTKNIKIFEFIRDHIQDYVFFGGYYGMLTTSRDESGHLSFGVEELLDPVSVISKKKRKENGELEEVFLAKGDDGSAYEIPADEIIYIAQNNLRLVNDLEEGWKNKTKYKPEKKIKVSDSKNGETNRSKVLVKESYMASEPLFYSLILKVKELIIKELLVSLISLRDLSSVQIFLLQFDKAIPLEAANDLCARAQKLANNTNELATFLSSNFDVVSFIENTLTQSAKFVPDYNASIGGKNTMLPLDKLSDKLLEIMQTIDQNKAGILGPLGLPATMIDSSSGSKWQVLQQSERANSRVAAFISGIKDSITNLVCNIYEKIYNSKLDPSLIKLHICEKTSVEYNNQINQSESISGLLGGISNIIQNALQTLDIATPLLDPKAFLNYIQSLIRDIDPNTKSIITDETIQLQLQIIQGKLNQMCEQLGIDPSQLQTNPNQ
jgi:hypothetical protein